MNRLTFFIAALSFPVFASSYDCDTEFKKAIAKGETRDVAIGTKGLDKDKPSEDYDVPMPAVRELTCGKQIRDIVNSSAVAGLMGPWLGPAISKKVADVACKEVDSAITDANKRVNAAQKKVHDTINDYDFLFK